MKRIGLLFCLVVTIIALIGVNRVRHNSNTLPTSQPTTTSEQFDRTRYSTSSPDSIWVVVNKQRPLPSSYQPTELRTPEVQRRGGSEMLLRQEAATALEKLFSDARQQGVNLTFVSGYRSYTYQQSVYNNFVKQDGEAAANRYSAKPGHSEHQTGLAADVGSSDGICQLEECFADTSAGKWVADNASRYGFIIRYQKGTEATVGFSFEPWHLRYVGQELAQELTRTKSTMETFFGLPSAPDYPS